MKIIENIDAEEIITPGFVIELKLPALIYCSKDIVPNLKCKFDNPKIIFCSLSICV